MVSGFFFHSLFGSRDNGYTKEPMGGIEPPACCLRNSRSDRLSYIGEKMMKVEAEAEAEVEAEKQVNLISSNESLFLYLNKHIKVTFIHFLLPHYSSNNIYTIPLIRKLRTLVCGPGRHSDHAG